MSKNKQKKAQPKIEEEVNEQEKIEKVKKVKKRVKKLKKRVKKELARLGWVDPLIWDGLDDEQKEKLVQGTPIHQI